MDKLKYLSRITLKNFQSHKYSVIEFNRGLNVIVGPSDTGKTAIIRAMKWVFYNEPAGDFFIREGENECSVIVEFNEGTKVERYRSRSKNIYILYDHNENEIRYEGFGTSVPEEILEATNMRKILLDSNGANAINLGEQLEGPFLLSEKTSTRASAIGRLIGVNIIDEALVETLKDLRNFTNQRKMLNENIEILNTELKDYEYLKAVSEKTDRVSEITNKLKEKSLKLSRLKTISKDIKKIEIEIEDINIYLKKLIHLDELITRIKDIKELENSFKHLNNINNRFKRYKQDIVNDRKILNSLENIDMIEKKYYTLEIQSIKKLKLDSIKRKTDSNEDSIFRINALKRRLKELTKIENIIKLIEQDMIDLLTYNKIFNNLRTNKKNLNIGTEYIKGFKQLDYVVNIHEGIEKNLKILNEYKTIFRKINNYKNDFKKEKDIEFKLNKEIEKELERYKKFLQSVEICPVCLSDINNDKIEHILEHYE